METNIQQDGHIIALAPDIELAFAAAVRVMDQYPCSNFVIAVEKGVPAVSQNDHHGDILVQAMAGSVGLPRNIVMQAAFLRVLQYAQDSAGRNVVFPHIGVSPSNTGNFVIQQIMNHTLG